MNANLKLLFLLVFVVSGSWAHAGAPPVFLTSPTNQTVYEGDPVTIACTASYDAGTMFYFQSTDGQTFSNSTPNFYFSSAWTGLAPSLGRVFATNSFGAAETDPFLIEVLPWSPRIGGPSFLIWDFGATFVQTNYYFTAVTGKPPFTYSLYQNDRLIQTTNQFSFAFTNVTHAQEGSYKLVVENPWGTASVEFKVFIKDFLRLRSHPEGQRAPLGGTALFQVDAESSGSIRYQWFHNGLAMVAATKASLIITNVALKDSGSYRCDLTVGTGPVALSLQTEYIYLDIDSSRPIDHWQHLSPRFGDASLFGVASVAGVTVAVAGNGTIWKSTNQIDWTRANSPVSGPILEVAYGNNQFVAIVSQPLYPYSLGSFSSTMGSTSVTSFDGTDWHVGISPTSASLSSIAFGAGHFVTISTSQIFSSDDGLQWTVSPSTMDGLRKVRFVNNRFIVLGAKQIALSEDGLSWNEVPAPEVFSAIAGNGEEYVALEYNRFRAWHSTNAVNWVPYPVDAKYFYPTDLAFNNGIYMAIALDFGGNLESGMYRIPLFATSRDGVAWDIKHLNCQGGLWSVIPTDSGFLAVGDFGNIISISESGSIILRGSVARSPYDAYRGSSFVQSPGSLIIQRNQYYASVLDGTEDLKTWRSAPLSHVVYAATYGNGVFLAVGGSNYSTSADGISWSSGSLPNGARNYGSRLGFDGKRFIDSFSGFVGVSTNAIDWVRIAGPTDFSEMSGANGLAILKRFNGSSSFFSVSTNGIDWTSKPFFNHPAKVIFDGTRYVGVGAVSSEVPSGLFSSNDGIHWTVSTNAPFALSSSARIAYGAGMYVVAASLPINVYTLESAFDPKLFVSTDAQHWDLILTGSHEPISDVTLFKGHWVILGRSGEILESIPISTLKLNPAANNLTVSGEGNTSYELQASEDLNSATWLPFTTLQTDANGSTTTNLSLPAATNLFLRLKQSD